MSTTTDTSFYIAKINSLITDGREDLIAGIVLDFDRAQLDDGAQPDVTAETDTPFPAL